MALVLAAMMAGQAVRAAAEEVVDAPPPPSRACPAAAAVYSSPKGLRLVATRHGSATPENPLRPLSGNGLLILQVVVNGRVATAFGPDADNMRQGPDPKRLEVQLGGPIKWSEAPEPYPEQIRVVAEDGRVLIDALRFQGCGEQPTAAIVGVPADAKPTRSGRGRTDPDAAARTPTTGADRRPLILPMPRGAL